MIVILFINLFVAILSIIFGWLPTVSALPTIGGFDIDSALSTGMAQVNMIMTSVWILKDLMAGFLFIMGYHIIKMVLKFILGSRAPHHS